MALILDGTSPTGAWSMHRDLLTSFVGGTRYTAVSGKVSQLADQSGNTRFFEPITGLPTREPSVSTGGPLNLTCVAFDGIDDMLSLKTGVNLDSLIGISDGYIVVSFIANAITSSAANVWEANPVWGDDAAHTGLFMKSPNILAAFNNGGTNDSVSTTIATATLCVAEWRHQGGSLYLRLNGGTEVSVASGNTSTGGCKPRIARTTGSAGVGDIKFFEMATWSTVPALATRNAIVADFMGQHVAATDARVTQSALEQFFVTNPNAQITQAALEMWATTATVTGQAIVTQTALEMWASVAELVLGRAKVWNGSAWNLKPVKVWSGAAWVEKPLKVWNGSAWT